jgi:hypothetical protein
LKLKVGEFETASRTVRIIRPYRLISPAPLDKESFFS